MESMEKTARKIKSVGRHKSDSRESLRELSCSMLFSGILIFCLSAVLSLYSPFEGISPFGMASIIAAWFSGISPYFASLGAATGYILSGRFEYVAASLIMGGAIYIFNSRFGSIMRALRLLIMFGVEVVSFLLIGLAARSNILLLIGASTVSVFGAVVIGGGLRALEMLPGGRSLSDTELLTLSALAGLITLSMGNFNISGQSPAVIFAGLCSLFAAYRFGISAVAFAVTVGAGRILACGGDMHFIAILAACTLLAASLRSLGKWASLLGFAAAGAGIAAFVRGTGILSFIECGAASLIFALTPARLYMPQSVRREIANPSKADQKYSRLQYRIASLCEVLSELSRAYGSDEGRMLEYISGTLKKYLNGGAHRLDVYTAECGTASSVKHGSSQSGDSYAMCDFDGKLLVALSDGMGSGNAASGESRTALALLKDLLSVGFEIDDATDCVNKLLSGCVNEDMYATLDVMLIDLKNGTARLSKHGAPSSFILRNGKVFTLYSEALPIGILENVQGKARSIRLKSGDIIIMMTDGVSDALGSGLIAAITDNVSGHGDTEAAAQALLDTALTNGRSDDMTIILTRVEETCA
ncbi:MAG: SpoIIE family protein phosphatase [Clostridia bacterium]|nr:SpoIIE family protein phosphatase [Clostridia bacterium]